jgi:hypothetical protein
LIVAQREFMGLTPYAGVYSHQMPHGPDRW